MPAKPDKVFRVMAQDITERIRSQEELKRFRMALDSSTDAVYLIDHELTRFIDANKTALATLGYTCEELMQLGHKISNRTGCTGQESAPL